METASLRTSILDHPEFPQLAKALGKYELADAVTSSFKAVESFVDCEILHRRAERARKLKLPKADYYESIAMLHNRQGLRTLQTARVALDKAAGKLRSGLEERISEKEVKELLDEHEAMLKNELFEQDLSPDEAEQIWGEYGRARAVADAQGARGLLERIVSNLHDLAATRTNLKKGRQEASPLPLWKIQVIAWTVRLAIVVVMLLLVVWPWVLTAASAFIRHLIESGC